ncbi:hypothetical protein C7476_109134 [Phyllobacterium bourgognense]|uniref:Uncharacterized protein n=1 Tax=Phyllobacterium bourgognense TaxID=314236 RepID=A0A368YNY5_9HYPH|nr:hypothetical protein C7476_109134 [Phyllobacterium bourgognense]
MRNLLAQQYNKNSPLLRSRASGLIPCKVGHTAQQVFGTHSTPHSYWKFYRLQRLGALA